VVGGTFGANFPTGAFVFGVKGDWDYSGSIPRHKHRLHLQRQLPNRQ
jgi:hypothetical protein